MNSVKIQGDIKMPSHLDTSANNEKLVQDERVVLGQCVAENNHTRTILYTSRYLMLQVQIGYDSMGQPQPKEDPSLILNGGRAAIASDAYGVNTIPTVLKRLEEACKKSIGFAGSSTQDEHLLIAETEKYRNDAMEMAKTAMKCSKQFLEEREEVKNSWFVPVPVRVAIYRNTSMPVVSNLLTKIEQAYSNLNLVNVKHNATLEKSPQGSSTPRLKGDTAQFFRKLTPTMGDQNSQLSSGPRLRSSYTR